MKLFSVHTFFSFFLLFGLVNQLDGDIVKTLDFSPIFSEIEKLDSTSLVIFDVDETLIIPKDKILRPCGEKHVLAFTSKFGGSVSADDQRILKSITMMQREITFTDPSIPHVFKTLKEKKIPTMALTALPAGKYGAIDSLEEWRRKELAQFGIDFQHHTPHHEKFTFDEIGERPPLFDKGILYSSHYSKGKALIAFLKKSKLKPSKILFIDDMKHHLVSVEEELKELNIPYLGFHFVGAAPPNEEIDEELALYQFQFLMKNKQWLSDVQALKSIESAKKDRL